MSSTALTSSSDSTGQPSTGTPGSFIPPSTPVLTITPKKDGTDPPKESTPRSSGWIHPRMDEVIRRRSANTFDGSNVRSILISSCCLLISLFAPGWVDNHIPTTWLNAIHPYPFYALWALRASFLLNISLSILPLIRTQDACEDIPLTPQQRHLLGLPPMSRSATPQEQEQYVTPPRFSRSNTPRSASSSIRATPGDSPLSSRGTPLDGNTSFRLSGGSGSPNSGIWRTESGSPFSGGPASGLRSRTMERRLSYTGDRKSSPMSFGETDSSGSLFSTPTKEKRASVGLNNKWLYERGRGSPRAGLRSSIPGGSVFN